MTASRSNLRLLALLALGVLVLAAGVAMARAWLPEWRSDPLPEKRLFVERYRELAARVGARLEPGEPRVTLATGDKESDLERPRLDSLPPAEAVAVGAGLRVDVRQPASLTASGPAEELLVEFLPAGDPWAMRWRSDSDVIKANLKANLQGKPLSPLSQRIQQVRLAYLLLRPEERLGPPMPGKPDTTVYPVLGSRPQQSIAVRTVAGQILFLTRELAGTKTGSPTSRVADIVLESVPRFLGGLAALVLFLALAVKRQIDFVNGAWIAAFLLVVSAVGVLVAQPNVKGCLTVAGAAFLSLWALALWSAGESFLRAVQPGMVMGLDALRAGRLGPRGGQALLAGVGFGALLAGLRLATLALAARLPGVWPADPSLVLPLFKETTPFYFGVLFAAAVAISLALAHRYLPARWAPWVATIAAGLVLPFAGLKPIGWLVAADVAAAGLLVLAARHAGLAALLAAAVCAFLFPAAAFSAFHLAWLPASFAVTAGFPLLLLVLGCVGLRRPEWTERERLRQPAFMRRLEEERRLSYEMDLLARMQRELLPASVPEIPGWEIQVVSLLATEAGGDLYDFLTDEAGDLWIAAGDVAGHGFSCAIVQAMTSAALTGTITAGQVPSAALRGVDRVIRRGGARRNFTSLAVVRLDPRTGEALLANAGHPFPLLLAHGGEVAEINLPGLPLGSGPPRTYADLPFHISPGGALVFCSDGLFEATDPRDNAYGYERPRDLLRTLGDRSAAEILAALFADWKAYRREDGPPADDTTVLVVKRKAAAAEPGTRGTAGTTGT
jgi:uncharacterized membrane protein YhaH (DUF805 family)